MCAQVRERKCQRSAAEPRPLEAREKLLMSIRAEPKLKPTARGQARLVETSRTRLDDTDGATQQAPAKKVIKPNISFQLNTFSVRALLAMIGFRCVYVLECACSHIHCTHSQVYIFIHPDERVITIK